MGSFDLPLSHSNGPLVLLKFQVSPDRLTRVAEYSQFLGRRVTVRYRLGEVLLSASGTFSADSGRSIFLEQSLEQRGGRKYFRWEIPYPYIYRIQTEPAGADGESIRSAQNGAVPSPGRGPDAVTFRRAAAASGLESPDHTASLTSFLNPRTSDETA